jgi:UPF0755 protein
MSYKALARLIALGQKRDEVSITIPEGKTLFQEAELLEKEGALPADFFRLSGDTLRAQSFDPLWKEEFVFLKELPAGTSLEGFLFPDTYRAWADQLPEGLMRKQLQEFEKRVPKIEKERGKRSFMEILTLASLVEKEVANPDDRKTVAGIFMRRLKEGMLLQSDATVNYVTRSGRTRSTADDLKVDSPYNTYLYKGLPPGPVSNPGDDAIDAALHPAETPYRYFLTDEQGKTYYARTLDEHIQNRYKAFGE